MHGRLLECLGNRTEEGHHGTACMFGMIPLLNYIFNVVPT